jgi:hypothetical protein
VGGVYHIRVRGAGRGGGSTLQIVADLVLKLLAVDAASAAARAGRVAALDHEIFDDAVENCVVVVAARGERGEVLAGFRGVARVELYEDRALVLVLALVWRGVVWEGKGACLPSWSRELRLLTFWWSR